MIEVHKAIEVYERLRKEAIDNTRQTGVEKLSLGLSEWRIEDNPGNQSKDLVITVPINGYRKEMVVRFDQLSLYARGETSTIQMSRRVREQIVKELSDFIAEILGEHTFRSCAMALVNLK